MIILMSYGYSQNECKAFIGTETYTSTYSGDCKKGLAHGYGEVSDLVKYVGQFKKGKPHGEGKIIYSNGLYYDGEWRDGLRHGEGEMLIKTKDNQDSLLSGLWRKDRFIGKKEKRPYEVSTSRGVKRYRFQKVNGYESGGEVEIRVTRNGAQFYNQLQNVQLRGDGIIFQDATSIGFESASFPFNGRISASVPNLLNSSNIYVLFQFVINEPGKWIVNIEL